MLGIDSERGIALTVSDSPLPRLQAKVSAIRHRLKIGSGAAQMAWWTTRSLDCSAQIWHRLGSRMTKARLGCIR